MMTETGYDNLEKRFKEIPIDIPVTMNIDELSGWLEGYKACLDNIFKVLSEMKKGSGVR